MRFLLFLAFACNRPKVQEPPPGAPDILFVSIDTLRADHLGCLGYDKPTSPAIDALCAKGTVFEWAFSPASWTLPAHMSMMTSLDPHVHGVDRPDVALPSTVPTLAEQLQKNGYETVGFASWLFTGPRYGFGRGFDRYEALLPAGVKGKANTDTKLEGAVRAETVVDEALEVLSQPSSKPRFLFVHLFDPHMHYDPPQPFGTQFGAKKPEVGRYSYLKKHIKGTSSTVTPVSDEDRVQALALYDGEIRYTDGQVARLLAAVDPNKTLVVLTSDHGEEFGDHGSMEGHQWTLYDESIHVPLIFAGPGVPTKRLDQVVELTDIAPTLLSLAGINAPFSGTNLTPLMQGEGTKGVRYAFSEITRFNRKWAIRDHEFKLIFTEDIGKNLFGQPISPGFELYDLANDPAETMNVWSPDHPAAERLRTQLSTRTDAVPIAEKGTRVELSEAERLRLEALGYVE